MTTYWDTSCLLKLYCAEEDSARFIALLDRGDDVPVTSKLTETELYFALQQKARRGETGGQSTDQIYNCFQSDAEARRIRFIPWGEDVFRTARHLASRCYAESPSPIFLRSLDGIHLASAILANCKRVHSTDERMRQASDYLGLQVFP